MKFFDTHTHVASVPQKYDDIDAVIMRAQKAGVEKIVDSGITIKSSKAVLALHEKYSDIILPTAGLHPELLVPGSDIYDENFDIKSSIGELENLLESEKYVAVGECGLDYYWLGKKGISNPESGIKEQQKELLTLQIELASKYELPLVVHSRGAEEECLEVIHHKRSAVSYKQKVLFHSYTGTLDIAKKVLEEGHYISFNGILTYPKADDIREIFTFAWKHYPEQILAETDAPYLAPEPKRGEVCEPAFVRFTVEKMSEIAETSPEEMSEVVYQNSCRFY